jgi:hypothetical protein
MRCSCRCDEIDPSEAFSSSSDMFTKTDEQIFPHQWLADLEWCRLCW